MYQLQQKKKLTMQEMISETGVMNGSLGAVHVIYGAFNVFLDGAVLSLWREIIR